MIKRFVSYNENLEKNIELLSKGIFLTTKSGSKVNSMTIAWGSIGFMWGKPVFTVTIPYKNVDKEIAFLGTKSGKDINKLAQLNIDTRESEKINTPVLNMEGMHFECRVLYKTTMSDKNLNEDIKNSKYPLEDYHTIYFGEIVSSYIIK